MRHSPRPQTHDATTHWGRGAVRPTSSCAKTRSTRFHRCLRCLRGSRCHVQDRTRLLSSFERCAPCTVDGSDRSWRDDDDTASTPLPFARALGLGQQAARRRHRLSPGRKPRSARAAWRQAASANRRTAPAAGGERQGSGQEDPHSGCRHRDSRHHPAVVSTAGCQEVRRLQEARPPRSGDASCAGRRS